METAPLRPPPLTSVPVVLIAAPAIPCTGSPAVRPAITKQRPPGREPATSRRLAWSGGGGGQGRGGEEEVVVMVGGGRGLDPRKGAGRPGTLRRADCVIHSAPLCFFSCFFFFLLFCMRLSCINIHLKLNNGGIITIKLQKKKRERERNPGACETPGGAAESSRRGKVIYISPSAGVCARKPAASKLNAGPCARLASALI